MALTIQKTDVEKNGEWNKIMTSVSTYPKTLQVKVCQQKGEGRGGVDWSVRTMQRCEIYVSRLVYVEVMDCSKNGSSLKYGF